MCSISLKWWGKNDRLERERGTICSGLPNCSVVFLCKLSETLQVQTPAVPPGTCLAPRLVGKPKAREVQLRWGESYPESHLRGVCSALFNANSSEHSLNQSTLRFYTIYAPFNRFILVCVQQ